MPSLDNMMLRQIIMDHYENPRNRELVEDDSYKKVNMDSETCIDNIDMQMKVENGVVVDAYFDGESCAICTSATSIIVKSLIGKTLEEANKILSNYQNMINEKDYDSDVLGELNVYDEIYLQPNRKKCALLPSDAAKKILDDVE